MKKAVKKFFDNLKKDLKNLDKTIRRITKRSKKSYLNILIDIYTCYIKYSITFDEYEKLKFETVKKDKRDTFVGKIRKEYINKHLIDKHALSLLNNKTKFNIKFDKYLNREKLQRI